MRVVMRSPSSHCLADLRRRPTRCAHTAQVKAERCESDSAIVKNEDGSTVYVSQEVCTVSLDNQNHAKERLQAATIKRLERKEAREECEPAPA